MTSADNQHPSPTSQRQAAYQAWAERLRRTKLEEQRFAAPPDEESDQPQSSDYWSPESLWRDSELTLAKEREAERVAQEREQQLTEALRILGLPAGSTLETVRLRYRELGEQLHADVNGDTSGAHAEKLSEVSAAYSIAKRLLGGPRD
ncbi:MAG: J domain-containing protein [Acidimicrobiales bacterium]|nr:J domain-containing protein [Acidimicrobiales bacterium]